MPRSETRLGEAKKNSPWAAWSGSTRGRQKRDGGPCGDAAVGCHRGATTYLGRRFRRTFRRKKRSTSSGGLDWREGDVFGASLNRNPENYRVRFISLPFAVSHPTPAAVKRAREMFCTQRPSLPRSRPVLSEQASSPRCPSNIPRAHLSSVLRIKLPGRLNPSFPRTRWRETPSIFFCPPLQCQGTVCLQDYLEIPSNKPPAPARTQNTGNMTPTLFLCCPVSATVGLLLRDSK